MSWFDEAERHVHANIVAKPDDLDPIIKCVQTFYPNMTSDNVSNLAWGIFDKWQEFNARHPSLASREVTFSADLIADIRGRLESGEDVDSLRIDLISKKLSLQETDEIVGRAILSKEPGTLSTSRGFMLSILADLPLGHPSALDICHTFLDAIRMPPRRR